MKLPTLFKKSSTGAIQQWTIKAVKDQDCFAAIVTEHGQVDGKMQTSIVHVRKGKNLGKANQTTPIQQAKLEAEAKWKKQLDKGYVETMDTTLMNDAVAKKPMLAQDYAKHKDKVKFPAFCQPKLDGMRCLAHKGAGKVLLYSRMGKPITTVNHINKALELMMEDGEIWDGELYRHDVDFQKLVSWIKREQPESHLVEYHIYDVVAEGDFYTRFATKRFQGPDDPREIWPKWFSIRLVTTTTVSSHDEVKENHDQFVSEGYEGAMVRQNGCPYKEGYRSRDLLKVKQFLEEEFKIIDIVDGKGKFKGLAIFRLETSDGTQFDAVPRGTEEARRDYFQNGENLIGEMATVRFFEWSTSESPVPRFPIVIAVRNYE